MNWPRYLRALAARRVEQVEQRRDRGIADNDALTTEDWEAVEAHDQLLSEYTDNGE